jgi:hypothetical protein
MNCSAAPWSLRVFWSWRNCSCYGVLLADGTTVALACEDRPRENPWSSLVGPPWVPGVNAGHLSLISKASVVTSVILKAVQATG